jgi:hypothetical protein
VNRLVESNGSALLMLVGIALGVAGFLDDRWQVTTVSVTLAASLIAMSALLPRLHGLLRFGPKGFEAELLRAVEKRAQEKKLPEKKKQEAIEAATRSGYELEMAAKIPSVATASVIRGGTMASLADSIVSDPKAYLTDPVVVPTEGFTFRKSLSDSHNDD